MIQLHFSSSEILGLQHFKDNFGKVLQLIQLTVANVIYIYTDCLANYIQTILSFDPSLLLKDSTNVRFPLLYIGYLKCRTLFGDIFVVTMMWLIDDVENRRGRGDKVVEHR